MRKLKLAYGLSLIVLNNKKMSPEKTENKPFLTITVQEGETGCRVECPEFGVGFSAPDREVAEHGLFIIVRDHSEVLISRSREGESISPDKLELAKRVHEIVTEGQNISEMFTFTL